MNGSPRKKPPPQDDGLKNIAGKLESDGYGAILFDKDGVLLDTIPYYTEAWQFALSSGAGCTIEPIEIFELEGRETGETARRLLANHGIEPEDDVVDEVLAAKDARFAEIFELVPFEKATELLDLVRDAGMKTALVTGSRAHVTEAQISDLFDECFDAVVTAGSVTHRKPHPEPWLTAAEILSLEPDRCLVVENAPPGIDAAKSAGMDCIAVATTLPPDRLKNADAVMETLADVYELVKSCSTRK